MRIAWEEQSVTAVVLAREPLPYPVDRLRSLLSSLARQHPSPVQTLVVGCSADVLGSNAGQNVATCGADSPSPAAALADAMQQVTGGWILLIAADTAAIELRNAALPTLMMAATRDEPAAMVYGDYRLVQPDGATADRHLLDHHPGRLRETADYGCVFLIRREALERSGGINAALMHTTLYDLRLRLSEQGRIVHVANRNSGALYDVLAPPTGHDVFDYLRVGREAQLEYERAVTAHLGRIGAYLEPGLFADQTVPAVSTPGDPGTASGERACLASVVIPVHRRPEFIGQAIESVLAQTQPRVEVVIVVNGGVDDPTSDEVRRYQPGGDKYRQNAAPVRLIVTDVNNLGLCLNLGIAAASGSFYVQLDSDDRLKPDAVEKLLKVFGADPTIGMVVGSYEVWDFDPASGKRSRNEQIPVVTHDEWTDDNGRNNLLRINGAGAPRAARIDVIAEVGWFGVNDSPQARNYGEDYNLVLRISERYRIGRVWEPIYEVNRHPGGTDHSIDQATIDRNDIAKDEMRLAAIRRRQAMNAGRNKSMEGRTDAAAR